MASVAAELLLSTFSSLTSAASTTNPPSQMQYFLLHHPLFSFFFFTFSLSLLILLKINKNKNSHQENDKPNINISSFSHPSADINKSNNEIGTNGFDGNSDIVETNNYNDNDYEKTRELHPACESVPTRLTHSLLLSFFPSDSADWEKLFSDDTGQPGLDQDVGGAEKGQQQTKKKKKRAKKKRPGSNNNNNNEEGKKEDEEDGVFGVVSECPFTTASSATQRRIKQQYDQLVKSHQSNGLTLAQVGQFVNCLIDARNELQHKSEVIQRRFSITKALLFRADRSSFDRLRQQIYKLELEQKRLEEDACVYNWLQQQFKLSPAYEKMLEIGACIGTKANTGEHIDSSDAAFSDISFEELLAREKKDTFWQRHGKPKQCSG